jgi:hypothetical protein
MLVFATRARRAMRSMLTPPTPCSKKRSSAARRIASSTRGLRGRPGPVTGAPIFVLPPRLAIVPLRY